MVRLLSFLYEKNWRFIFYCLNYFVICSKFRAVLLFLSTARNWHVEHVRHTFFVEQLTFFCRADDFFKKSVEQSRFEQLHFEQLTLTHPVDLPIIIYFQFVNKNAIKPNSSYPMVLSTWPKAQLLLCQQLNYFLTECYPQKNRTISWELKKQYVNNKSTPSIPNHNNSWGEKPLTF